MKRTQLLLFTILLLAIVMGCKDVEEEPAPSFETYLVASQILGEWEYYEMMEDGSASGRSIIAYPKNGKWTFTSTTVQRTGEVWYGNATSTKPYDIYKNQSTMYIKVQDELPYTLTVMDAKNMVWERTERAYKDGQDLGSFNLIKYKFRKP